MDSLLLYGGFNSLIWLQNGFGLEQMTYKNIVMGEGYYSAIERKTCALHVKCALVVMHIKTIRPCKFYFDYISLQKSSISCNQVKITTHRNLNVIWRDLN